MWIKTHLNKGKGQERSLESIIESHVKKRLQESQGKKKSNRRGSKGNKTHCARMSETETERHSTLGRKAPPPPQIEAAQDLQWAAQISHFENPPSSQPRLLARWGPQPGCGRVCCPAPQNPSPRHHQQSAKKKGHDHFQAAPWNSRGQLLNGPRCNFNISVLPKHSRVQAAMPLMGKALSKGFLLLLMKLFSWTRRL